MTEHEILVEETKQESTDAKVWLGAYTKQKLITLIKEFPELKHPLPVYRFINPLGLILETTELTKFAQLHGLSQPNLSQMKSTNSYKGWIKCPDNYINSTLEERIALLKLIKNTNDVPRKKFAKQIY